MMINFIKWSHYILGLVPKADIKDILSENQISTDCRFIETESTDIIDWLNKRNPTKIKKGPPRDDPFYLFLTLPSQKTTFKISLCSILFLKLHIFIDNYFNMLYNYYKKSKETSNGKRFNAQSFWQPQRAALRSGFHLSSDL
jgi:hypothetical protein